MMSKISTAVTADFVAGQEIMRVSKKLTEDLMEENQKLLEAYTDVSLKLASAQTKRNLDTVDNMKELLGLRPFSKHPSDDDKDVDVLLLRFPGETLIFEVGVYCGKTGRFYIKNEKNLQENMLDITVYATSRYLGYLGWLPLVDKRRTT